MYNRLLHKLLNSDYRVLCIYFGVWVVVFSLAFDGKLFLYGLVLGLIYTLMNLYAMKVQNHSALSADSKALPVLLISFVMMAYFLVKAGLWRWPDTLMIVGGLSSIAILSGHAAVMVLGLTIDKVVTSELKLADKRKLHKPVKLRTGRSAGAKATYHAKAFGSKPQIVRAAKIENRIF